MQRSQVFKVKGMQRDLSMANTNGEFAYEIVNMRLLPAEEDAGLSLTNEQGTLCVIEGIEGDVLGQCPTSDSLVVFTHGNKDRIYKISYNGITWLNQCLYEGNLNFQTKIEAIFNYETSDIQKVYWIDGINQLRCINLEDYGKVTWNDSSFDSIKQIDSLPTVEIERTTGGSFVAGVLQYYISYFTEFGSESPIVYTSPLLYLAHENRGGNVNDSVSTAFKLTLSNLDTTNWNSIRIYVTHRTSLDATPEGSIIQELKIPANGIIEFTDYGLNRVSISPNDLYFVGGKFVKAGTMTVKDQVMFLGNLDIQTDIAVKYDAIVSLFSELRDNNQIDKFFFTDTRKQIDNSLLEYPETYYSYKSQLSNTNSITHYKYGEKYRFGISVMDIYGVWSNPIWIKDEFIVTPPEQSSIEVLELPCPSLNLSILVDDDSTLWQKLQSLGVKQIKPLVVFPQEEERKVIAQGVVCPTVYNLKDRKENGPYAQASWFMRPNAPVDLWGISSDVFGKPNQTIVDGFTSSISHKSDLMNFVDGQISGYSDAGYYGASSATSLSNGMTGFDYLYDDFSAIKISKSIATDNWNSSVQLYDTSKLVASPSKILDSISYEEQAKQYKKGSWVEFRHNYALRTKGWSFGAPTTSNPWTRPYIMTSNTGDHLEGSNIGMVRGAELDVSRFDMIPPTNRFQRKNNSNIEPQTETISKETVLATLDNLYFCSILSPKEFHKSQRDGDCPSISVIYKYTKDNQEYTQIIDTIIFPKEKQDFGGNYYVRFSSPWEFLNIPETILPGSQGNIWVNNMHLKAKRSDSPVQLKEGGAYYYIWKFRSVSNLPTEISKTDYVNNFMPAPIEIVCNSELEGLYYGDRPISNVSLGNSAYYVDNSIVTLNSPEIEFTKRDTNLSDSNFRIVGIIPLTATASDMSVEVTSAATDTDLRGSGLVKQTYSNTNIGYHGFKGIVSSNAYLTNTHDTVYSLVPLAPWHSTGTLGQYKNLSEEFKTKDILKRKILSNLRYSASTYFFTTSSTFVDGYGTPNGDNTAILNSRCAGWKPAKGCTIQTFTGEEASNIIKLEDLQYSTKSLVYKGNIDSIALLTKANANDVIPNPIYSFKHNPSLTEVDSNSYVRMNSPAVGIYKDTDGAEESNKFKTAQGASIKYKSSPHYVIGFKCFDSLWGAQQKIQETLPAWKGINEEGISSTDHSYGSMIFLKHGQLYEDASISSLYHQSRITVDNINIDTSDDNSSIYNLFRTADKVDNEWKEVAPNYGWLWLGEIYRETDPTFGGTSDYALLNNQWMNAGKSEDKEVLVFDASASKVSYLVCTIYIDENWSSDTFMESEIEVDTDSKHVMFSGYGYNTSRDIYCNITLNEKAINVLINKIENKQFDKFALNVQYADPAYTGQHDLDCEILLQNDGTYSIRFSDFPSTLFRTLRISNIGYEAWPKTTVKVPYLSWTIGDTYYQRFDTLKTYAYSDSDQNSVIDITSFMVETRINIDGRYDRNRGQESNLQMSPTNFNLFNDVYNQKDNFFTYRILDDDVQSRTKFTNQITWSLSKTAGETIDSWLNVTLASVLDLDGTKGDLTALKTFGNNIVAFQDSGISQILFNSRVQIPTSENVPIQIANSGKVDGQQFITTDIGCQDKWNIVTTSQGLYFIDYRDKSIYKFNGQLANLSATGGFRGWCEKHITDQSTIVGYYDIKNKEVMFYDSNFSTESVTDKVWLGFSEMSNHFSSFYTYPEAYLTRIQGTPVWLYNKKVYQHQAGNYNDLLGVNGIYGLTINTRQDSNLVKTFNTVEFRADTYINKNASTPEVNTTFDTIQIEDEHDGKTVGTLSFNQYRPSNLKKYLRTWRAQIPRVKNKYNRYVNQWAKIGLWKTDPSLEKTILHDMAVWYSE